jgi:hypothetical protein
MPINRGPITRGADFNFFEKLEVTNTTFGDPNDGYQADIIISLRGPLKTLFLVNEGSEVIEYSFNGNTLHGDLTPGTPTAALSFDNRPVSKMWFRVAGGSSIIRVEAWAGV